MAIYTKIRCETRRFQQKSPGLKNICNVSLLNLFLTIEREIFRVKNQRKALRYPTSDHDLVFAGKTNKDQKTFLCNATKNVHVTKDFDIRQKKCAVRHFQQKCPVVFCEVVMI